MTIVFEMSGKKRKELVNAISEITGAKAVYKFMPTCAYEIRSYTVNKNGSLDTGNYDKAEVRELIAALADKGFVCNEEGVEIAAETPTQPDTEGNAESVDRFSISMKRDFFDEALFGKLDRLIESKSDLFKMAFKTDDLSYEVTEDRVTFAWFPWTGEADEGTAYSTFIDLLTKHLKEHKRINASKTQTDNPKFAMRVFLIRLGMVGDEFKMTRKILLRNLKGSSAFRKGVKQNEDIE